MDELGLTDRYMQMNDSKRLTLFGLSIVDGALSHDWPPHYSSFTLNIMYINTNPSRRIKSMKISYEINLSKYSFVTYYIIFKNGHLLSTSYWSRYSAVLYRKQCFYRVIWCSYHWQLHLCPTTPQTVNCPVCTVYIVYLERRFKYNKSKLLIFYNAWAANWACSIID